MKVEVAIGEVHRFELREALLIYREDQRSFITLHSLEARRQGPPVLGPARPLTTGFLENLAESLWPRRVVERNGRKAPTLSIGHVDRIAPDVGPVHSGEVVTMRIEHVFPPEFLSRRPVRVLVVGAGGTGSAIAMELPYLHQAVLAWGHAYGLEVSLMDADTVSDTNCVRQPFSWSDIGQNKATVLINRINLFWGTQWSALRANFDQTTLRGNYDRSPDILIGCVDTRAARRVIADALTKPSSRVAYWLDLGNNASSGQYVLGQPLNARNRRKADRLRLVSEVYPEIVDTVAGEDPLPSCSAVEALERQEPFINQTLAASALAMLARLFRYGRLRHHGGIFSASSGLMTALPVDPDAWRKTRRATANTRRLHASQV